jgi:multiple sugar transport system substrate-binding protein
MIYDDDYFASLYEDPAQSKVAGKIKYANLGGPKGMFTDYYYFGTAIGQNGKHKGAAWLLAQFLTSKKAMRDVTVKYRNLMPTRFSTLNDAGFKELVGGWGGGTWVQTVNNVMDKWGLSAFTPTDQPQTVRDKWDAAGQKIYEGAPVKETLAAAANEINAALEKSGFRKKSG